MTVKDKLRFRDHRQQDSVIEDGKLECINSCDRCDFESEVEKELEVHVMNNIHNVMYSNKNLVDVIEVGKAVIYCDLCEDTSNDEKDKKVRDNDIGMRYLRFPLRMVMTNGQR